MAGAADELAGGANEMARVEELASGADESATLAFWAETNRHSGAEVLLLPRPVEHSARIATDSGLRWGGLVTASGAGSAALTAEGQARPWLDSGATIIGILDGASPDVLAKVRDAIDESERVDVEARAAVQARWSGHVSRAARVAPGGRALWLGVAADAPLPDGFEWLTVSTAESRHLPEGHFRLIISPAGEAGEPEVLSPLLQDGGILVLPHEGPLHDVAGLRLLSLDTESEPPLALYRRED